MLGVVIACAQCVHSIETAHSARNDGSLSTSAHDDICLAQTNEVECIGQCIGRRGASTGGDIVGTVESVLDANLSGTNVGNHLRHEEGAELGAQSVLMQCIIDNLVLKGLHSADSHTEHHAHTVLVDSFQINGAIVHSHACCSHCIMAVGVHLAGFLTVDIVLGLETLQLTSKLGLELGGIEMRDRRSTAHAVEQLLPRFRSGVAQRAHSAYASHYYSLQLHI